MKLGATPVTAFPAWPPGGWGGSTARLPDRDPLTLRPPPPLWARVPPLSQPGVPRRRGPLSPAAPPSSCCCSRLEPGGPTTCPPSQGAPETRWEGSGRPPSVGASRVPVTWETGSHHPPCAASACGSGQKVHLGLGTACSTGRAGGSEGLSCFWKVGEEHRRAGPPGLVGLGPWGRKTPGA